MIGSIGINKTPVGNNGVGSINANNDMTGGSGSGISSSDLTSLMSRSSTELAQQQALTKLEQSPSNHTEAHLETAIQDLINEHDPKNDSAIMQGIARDSEMKRGNTSPLTESPVAAQTPGSDPESAGMAQFQKGENELTYAKAFDKNGHTEAREARQDFEKGDFKGAFEHMQNAKFNFDNARKTGREAQTDMRQGRATAFGSMNADGAAADGAVRGAINAGPKSLPIGDDSGLEGPRFVDKRPLFDRTSKL